MLAEFVEMPAFARHREAYLSDEEFRALQVLLQRSPDAGDVIQGAGGLRKLRFAEKKRGKGSRGGLRVIYFWWTRGNQCWLFTLYAKGEVADLTPEQRKAFREALKSELEARS